MEVKNFILYQIATDRNYKVGDKLTFGNQLNFQGERVVNGAKLETGHRLYDDGFAYADNKQIFKNGKLVLKLSKALEEYDFITRELAFEEVRKQKFAILPSRLKCMFLTESEADVLKNLKNFWQKGHGTLFQAVKVKLTGKLFYARTVPVTREALSYADYLKKAEEYWQQDQTLTEPKPYEILFEGTAEIVEILDEYTHKQ